MYQPKFNTVLVQIDDQDAKWGTGIDDSMLGKSFREGTFIDFGELVPDDKYAIETIIDLADKLSELKGKHIMWNEGVEAGTIHEVDGKQYAFIYWWDIRGVKN